MNKKPLQIITAILGLVPLITGIVTMLGINDPIYASAAIPAVPLLDSNLRFFGGVWLGLGLAILWLVPPTVRLVGTSPLLESEPTMGVKVEVP